MIRMRGVLTVVMVATLWATAAVGADVMDAEKASVEPILVETSVDRSAVFVGDPIIYTIRITCSAGTDIVADDLSEDQLKLTGLVVASSTQQRDARADGSIVYHAQFRLVSFEKEGVAAAIEQQTVRYYVHTAGQPIDTLVPAAEVQLPTRTISVHSTLPNGDVEWLRDAPRRFTLPTALAYTTWIGMLAVLLALVPVAVGLAGVVRIGMPWRGVRSRRDTSRLRRRALEEIRVGDVADADSRRDLFDKLNALMRECLTDFQIPAQSLTVDEIEQAFADRAKGPRLDGVVAALRDCESAVYGRAEELPGPNAVAAAMAQAERLLATRVR